MSTIEKEALEYVVGLGTNEIVEVGGQSYSTTKIFLVPEATTSPLIVRSLSGLIDYLKSNFDKQPPVLLHIESPTKVYATSTFNRDLNRNVLIKAEALLPDIRFGYYYDVESFNVLLQSSFVPENDRASVLSLVGSVREDDVRTIGDNGISQSVVARTGVATNAEVVVPNPVILKPFRTFVEVQQPESDFIFRMKKGPECALFEADGGAWKIAAMDYIKSHLEFHLEKEIEEKQVVIIS